MLTAPVKISSPVKLHETCSGGSSNCGMLINVKLSRNDGMDRKKIPLKKMKYDETPGKIIVHFKIIYSNLMDTQNQCIE